MSSIAHDSQGWFTVGQLSIDRLLGERFFTFTHSCPEPPGYQGPTTIFLVHL